MFCPNCGNSLDDYAKFCPRCGAQIENMADKQGEQRASSSNEGKEKAAAFQEKIEASQRYVTDKKNRKKVIVGVIILLVVVFFCLLGSSLDKDVRIVKTGHFYAAQNITVGDAFDKFLQIRNGNRVSTAIRIMFISKVMPEIHRARDTRNSGQHLSSIPIKGHSI